MIRAKITKKIIIIIVLLIVSVVVGIYAGILFNNSVQYNELLIYSTIKSADGTNITGPILKISNSKSFNLDFNRLEFNGTSPEISIFLDNQGLNLTLPSKLEANKTLFINISGIKIDRGMEFENMYTHAKMIITPIDFYYAWPPNMSVILVGQLMAETPLGRIPWESYVLYSAGYLQGGNQYRIFTNSFAIAFFVVVAVIVWGFILAITHNDRKLFPFATLLLLAINIGTYVFVGGGADVSLAPNRSLFRLLPFPLAYHGGYDHITGNLPSFVLASVLVESFIARRNLKRFMILYVTPLSTAAILGLLPTIVSFVNHSKFVFSYGLSTLIGMLIVGLWAYLFLFWNDFTNKRGLLIVGISCIAVYGVIFGYLWYFLFRWPFYTPYDENMTFGHIFSSLFGGILVYALIKIFLKEPSTNK